MRKLALRPEGAKKPASISPDDSSPLLLIDPPMPEFEPPDPSFVPPIDDDAVWPEFRESHTPPLFRNASRRVLHAHRFRLVMCPYESMLLIALDRNCLELGHTLIAQGGVSPAKVSFPILLAKAQAMEAAGIILMQNRPGRVSREPPVNPLVTVEIALFCDWAGIPLIEHIYINRKGEPFFVRERGILNNVPTLLTTLRKGTQDIAQKELDRGICDPKYYEEKRAAQAAAETPPPIEIITRTRR